MKRVLQPRKGRKNFNIAPVRRREIERLAKYLGAADTEDFDRFLIAWHWHNSQSNYPIDALIEAAQRMGGWITEERASEIIEEASNLCPRRTADALARFLGLKYTVRQKLRIWTIGSKDVGKKARKELRKRQNRIAHERRRRELGMKPQVQSLSRTRPWEDEGKCKATWYRQNKHRTSRETTLSALFLVRAEDKPVSGLAEASQLGSESKPGGYTSSRTATLLRADIHVRVPNWCFGRKPTAELRVAA